MIYINLDYTSIKKKYQNKLFLILLMTVFSITTQAQSFQDLFNHAKQEFNEMLKTNSSRLTDEGLNYLKDKAEKIKIVSSQTKQVNSKTNTLFVNEISRPISSDSTEEFLKQNYPNFYFLYKDVLKDSLVKEVLFVIREKKDWIAHCNQNGTIFFDLNQFDASKSKSDENEKCWALLIMQGNLYQMQTNSNLNGVEKEYYKFQFAFQKAKSYAEAGHCNALRRAVNYWKNKDIPDSNKKTARDQLINTKEFTDAEKWIISANCK